MMNILQNTTRSKFEQFAVDEGMNVKTEKSGGYQSATTNRAYLAWLAAKRMYEVEPVRVSQHEAMTEQDARIAELTAEVERLRAQNDALSRISARAHAVLKDTPRACFSMYTKNTRESRSFGDQCDEIVDMVRAMNDIARNGLREG